jgi:hypothetical protein
MAYTLKKNDDDDDDDDENRLNPQWYHFQPNILILYGMIGLWCHHVHMSVPFL